MPRADARAPRARRDRFGAGLGPGLAAAVLIVAGCAPHVVHLPELEPSVRSERYRVARAARAARGAAVEADVVLWTEAPTGNRLPGAEGRLLLASPDAFRLRVGSLFGTALDLGARGDSLVAYVPSRRRALMLDATRDSVGVQHPGELAFRAFTGSWEPPGEAWERAAWSDTLLRVAWLEGEDTLAVAVGSDGLPAWASFTRPDGGGARVDYLAWNRSSGVAWPSRFTVEELGGAFRITCKAERIRFNSPAEPSRLAVVVPRNAVPLTVADLRRLLQRMGAL